MRRATRLVLLALAVTGVPPAMAADCPAPKLQTLARALQPGEPVRVVLQAPTALSAVRGRWQERLLSFFPSDDSARRWSAWAVIPLEARSGPTTMTVDATCVDGAVQHLEQTLTLRTKRFPEERLRVEPKFAEPPAEVQPRLAREREFLATVYARLSSPARQIGAFVRPVPGAPSSIFGKRRYFNGKPRDPHPGLDLRAATGTPVRCSGLGSVSVARDLYYSGNTVIVDHGGGLFTVYAHLSRIDVLEGTRIEPGATVGLSGATGRVTGPHLHWGAKLGAIPFDPTALLDPKLFPVH